jgi:hypothetical protein
MRRRALIVVVAALLAGVGAGVSRAGQPPVDLAGQPFYFSATCTGLGEVILANQSLSRTAALHVVGANTVIIATFGSIGGARGTQHQSNGTCTFTGGGFTPTTIAPFDEPFTEPVFVVSGSAA